MKRSLCPPFYSLSVICRDLRVFFLKAQLCLSKPAQSTHHVRFNLMGIAFERFKIYFSHSKE